MDFLKPALIFTALACLVLSGSFLYVWIAYTRRRYALCWGLSWLAAVPHLACSWVLISAPELHVVQALDQVLLVANAALMVCGCLDFVHGRIPTRTVVLVALPFLTWGVLAPLYATEFSRAQLPNAVLLGGSYLFTAMSFLHLRRTRRTRGSLVIAILFALAGLHEFDYPLFGNLAWATAIGYTLASVLATLIALSLLILILEEARADVEEERARLRGILDALPVGVVMFRRDGSAALDNAMSRTMLGNTATATPTTLQDLAGRLLVPAEAMHRRASHDSPMARTFATGEVCVPEEFALCNPDAIPRAVLVNAGPVHDARAQLLGVVTVLQDVEEWKHIERQMVRSQRLQSLGTLAAGVAHNFNNALTLMLGHAQLARHAADLPSMRSRVESISQIASDSVGIVGRIQSLARSRPAGARAESVVELAALVRDVVELTRPRWLEGAKAEGVHYEVRTELVDGVEIRAQAAELRESVLNLVINALDAMPRGGRLTFEVGIDAGHAVLRLTDDGEGMPAEVRERVFDPFFTTKGARGTGLGLSLVFGVVERLGGEIAVESAPGSGTTFTLRFPLAGSGSAHSAMPEVRAASVARHVLVVEDDPVLRNLTVEMLEQQGHRATPAASGQAALRMLEGSDIDLVFTDLSMPGVTGWDVVSHAARVRPGIPVVLVTGWGQLISPTECAAAVERSAAPIQRAA
ncbi:MAG: response regulator [Candidatus Eisenbacteria bacterium]|uniref:histidine kinase n=1 Tax=Eiseniibacteriota bacterium TaxID=2212470 RepID=A0A849SRK3_UNCEI|nr:response regulator [Candidatus Eisenbacteria bacterium]